MKHHLAGIKKDVITCTSVSDYIKYMFMKLLEDKEKIKEANRQNCFKRSGYPR